MTTPSTSDEAPAGDTARGFREQASTDTAILAHDDAQRKTRATLSAKLALAGGYVLLELADGTFLVSRWNYCKPLPDLHAVAAFARQIGGAA